MDKKILKLYKIKINKQLVGWSLFWRDYRTGPIAEAPTYYEMPDGYAIRHHLPIGQTDNHIVDPVPYLYNERCPIYPATIVMDSNGEPIVLDAYDSIVWLRRYDMPPVEIDLCAYLDDQGAICGYGINGLATDETGDDDRYLLPVGYRIAESNCGEMQIYDYHDRHCSLELSYTSRPLLITTSDGMITLQSASKACQE